MRRVLIIVAMLIVLAGVAVGLYFLFFGSTAHLTVSNGSAFSDTGSGSVGTQNTTEPGTGSTNAGTAVAPNLIRITASPVAAGEVSFDIPPVAATSLPTSSSTASSSATATSFVPGDVEVRYIDRESGNIYSYLALTRKLSRISNKTLPGIQEASWLPDGSMALVRFLAEANGSSHVDTYALPANGNGGYFLQQDLNQAIVLGQNSVFVLLASTESSVGSTAHADGTGVATLFTTPLTSIVARAAGAGIVAVTKASASLDGYAFSFSGGTFAPVLGPLKGLTVLPSPDGKTLLYSYTDGTNFHMATFDLAAGTIVNLPLATLAEKCVWTSDSTALYCAIPTSFSGTLPDDWYQGAVSFTDQIWRIDLTSRLATLVVDPSATGKVDIDAVNLTIDPNSQVLFFRNKKDSSLWAYSL